MTNGFRGLLVGWGEPIYVKLKEVEKLAVRHFKRTSHGSYPHNLHLVQDFRPLPTFSIRVSKSFFTFDTKPLE